MRVLHRGYASSLAHRLKAQERYDRVWPNAQPIGQPSLVEPPEALSSNGLAQAVTHPTVQTPVPCHLQQAYTTNEAQLGQQQAGWWHHRWSSKRVHSQTS